MFNPQRLTLARTRRGKTIRALADDVDVDARTVSRYEAGDHEPPDEVLRKISRKLDFPVEFFGRPSIDMPGVDGVSFRSLASMTASKRDAAIGSATLAVEFSQWAEKYVDYPEPRLPSLRGYDAETAADALRAEWGLGERPIKNVVHQLESCGVRVFSLSEDGPEVDAFSFWIGPTPYIFLNHKKTAEHSRFDAAHELGHLCLHRHGGPRSNGNTSEREANVFASAFLLPSGGVRAVAPAIPHVDALVALKTRWGVSAMALNYRLHALKLTTYWHYRAACIELSRLGYRTHEPDATRQHETSQALEKVFQILREKKKGMADIAAELFITESELKSFVFGLVMRHVPGNGGVPVPRRWSPNLRRVK